MQAYRGAGEQRWGHGVGTGAGKTSRQWGERQGKGLGAAVGQSAAGWYVRTETIAWQVPVQRRHAIQV